MDVPITCFKRREFGLTHVARHSENEDEKSHIDDAEKSKEDYILLKWNYNSIIERS